MKQRMVSGIKPSGDLHIGNYLGAIKQWVALQEEYDLFLFVADLHAITVPQKPEELRRRTIEIAKIYLAAGLDPAKTTLFAQSQVPEHAQLGWILNTIARMGDLEKMTQFKDKAGIIDTQKIIQEGIFHQNESLKKARELGEKIDSYFNESNITADKIVELFRVSRDAKEDLLELHELLSRLMNSSKPILEELFGIVREDNLSLESLAEDFSQRRKLETAGVGLFDYPVLMAGDILLYDAQKVPVGEDQTQHVELTRTLARRFNKRFGDDRFFTIPQPLVQAEGARIMALDNPTKKMSKSAASEYSYIALMDTPEQARKKIMKAVTDSGMEIVYRDDKPALKNLINIFALLGDTTTEAIVERFAGKGYAEFKGALADVVAQFLTDFQARYASFSDETVREILAAGAAKARPIAEAKLARAYSLVGLR